MQPLMGKLVLQGPQVLSRERSEQLWLVLGQWLELPALSPACSGQLQPELVVLQVWQGQQVPSPTCPTRPQLLVWQVLLGPQVLQERLVPSPTCPTQPQLLVWQVLLGPQVLQERLVPSPTCPTQPPLLVCQVLLGQLVLQGRQVLSPTCSTLRLLMLLWQVLLELQALYPTHSEFVLH